MLNSRFFNVVFAATFCLSIGCASSTPPQEPCESDEDCAVGEVCDREEGTCDRLDIVINNDDNHAPVNVTPNGEPNNTDTPDVGEADMTRPDAGPGTDDASNDDTNPADDTAPPDDCTPQCGDEEVCENGQCVSACSPECQAPEVCSGGSCQLPDCTAVGDLCDPARPDQGNFGCLPDGAGGGNCHAKCDEPRTADECPSGEYCWPVDDDLDLCVPSTCDRNLDCDDGNTSGSCIRFDNDFRICLAAGNVAAGDPCDPESATPECQSGTACRETLAGGGVCSFLCDPWAEPSNCGAGTHCSEFFTFRQGLCSDDTDPLGSAPFQECATPGAACTDASQCFDFSTDFCVRYCRPGAGDCAGVTDGSGAPTVCDDYFFPGVREVGVCWPVCNSNWCTDSDPNVTLQCVDQKCRAACTPGGTDTEIANECCGGSMPCSYACNSQTSLCE